MGTQVGGIPDSIANGAGKLSNVAKAVHDSSPGVSKNAASAAGAAGDDTVSAAIKRFGSAYSRYTLDLGAQFGAASTLAQHGAEDLDAAGGHPR